ncbi:MAG: S41 family peptidase [Clostridiales bacterium]|jgi:carboxyl-terminal processing protease|nr:S41 family peptidase [Clostridiales bacterium]
MDIDTNTRNNKNRYIEGLIQGAIAGVVLIMLFNYGLSALNSGGGLWSDPDGFEDKVSEVYDRIDKYYVEDYDKEDVENGMLVGMVYGLGDIYSAYMDAATFKSFTEETEGIYTGVGAVVSDTEDGRVLVVSPYDGSPAAKAGLKPQDVITHVNGIDILGAGVDNVVAMMKGEPGTTVNVTVFRESESRTFDTDITRDVITMQTVTSKMMDNNMGYIRLSGFEGVTFEQFDSALTKLKSEGAKGYILDVRNNPGGRLDIVADICDRLVPQGTIVYTEDKDGDKEFLKSDAEYLDMPMILLVNGNSASASEVLAGAVKDYEVATLVGEQTFGKGVVQQIFPLEDGSAVKLTTSRYYSPKGVCIHGEGIAPDYVVPMAPELTADVANIAYEDDVQLQKAVEVLGEMMK